MKHSQQNKTNIGLQQKSSILQAWVNLKDSIFNVLFVLLDKNDEDEQQSIWGLVFESGLDYLQMMAFPFNVAIISVWNGGQTLNSITSLFQQFNLSSYLPGVSFGAFLLLLYSLIFLIILVILDIVYVSYSFSKKKFKFTWPLILLAQIVPLFVTVFFLPMTQTLLSVVQCQAAVGQGYQVMQSFPDVICWQGWHLFHAAITLLFVSIFVFICCVVGLAMFQPRMTTNKLTARQNSQAEVVFIFNKIVNQFIFSFTPFSETWMYCVILFMLAFWQFWCYAVNEPYYNKKATKFFKIASTYYFWTVFMLMVSQILIIYNFTGGLVIWLGGLPFICIVIFFQRKSDIAILFSSNLKFRSGQELQSHITYVLQLIQNQKKDKNSYMLLIGYIEKHKQICTEEDCPFKKYLKKKKIGKNQMEDNCVQLLKQLERMYKIGIKKYPESTKLRISFAFFHLERTKNKNKAFQQFTSAENTDPSFEEQFIIYRFKKIIRQNLEDDQKQSGSDLIQMIRFDNHISLCEEAMLTSARLHKQFWTQLKQQTPDLKKLNDIGSKITQTSNAVKQNYTQINKINSSVPEILHNYSIYLLLILQDYAEGVQMFANAKKIYQDKVTGIGKSQEQLNDKHERILCPMIVISSNQGKLGKVLNCNLMFTEMTGYYKQQICDRDFQKILPDTYKLAHQYTINQWSKGGNNQSQYMSKANEGFIKQKSGTIIPISYLIRYNAVQEEFIVTFKLDSNRGTKCILLTNSMGVIHDCSSLSKNFFQIDSTTIQSEILYLQNLGIDDFQNQKYIQGKKSLLHVQETQKLCQVKISPILMKTNYTMDGNQSEDQSQRLIGNSNLDKQVVGYIVEVYVIAKNQKSSKDIQLARSQKLVQENSNNQISMQSIKQSEKLQMNNQILDLYQAPQLNFVYLASLAQSKRQDVVLRQFQLTQKIKTMRLMNNQIKMVYNQGSQNDYICREGLNFQDQRQMSKFDDQNYQAKLRKAINTNINHIQISRLRWSSLVYMIILFLLIILQLVLSSDNLNQIKSAMKRSSQMSAEMQTLSKFISGSIQPLQDNTEYFKELMDYKIDLQSDEKIKYSLNEQEVSQKLFKDVLILLHSKLLDYFYHSEAYTLNNVYYNYVNFVYSAFEQYDLSQKVQRYLPYIFFAFIIFISTIMIIAWICISLMIDKKRFDIMIWFLDIPIPYVSHLGNHCDKYLKQFIGIKELMEKGLNIDQQLTFTQFSQSKDHTKQDQLEQQIKARKSLIAKHRKQTLFSKLNCGYISFFWVLIYSSLISVIMIIMSQNLINKFDYIAPQWQLTYHQINWGCALPISLKLQQKYETIGYVNLTKFSEQLKTNNLNTITRFNMEAFNQAIEDFDSQFSAKYQQIYYQSLCTLAKQKGNSSQATQCQEILKSKLSGGYTVYSAFISSAQISEADNIRIANQRYSIPELIGLLLTWKANLTNQIEESISLCLIGLYLYVILSIFGFLIFWMMYLKNLNTQLNQTIQMLNMIPFKLLPKSRKQTKQFIAWIIKEANKKNHENQ